MGRYTGPKNRLSRREGIDLGNKSVGSKAHAMLLKRLNVPPGMHGAKGHRKVSEYGEQLREKQKVKRLYGVMERQIRKTFAYAKKSKGNTGEKFMELLERRLDNTIYRMGLAPTRASSRQFVSHGHTLVNGKKLDIPSYCVMPNDVITMKTKALEIPAVKKMIDADSPTIPGWVERKGPVGRVVRLPIRSDIVEDVSEQLIIEFYSR